MVALVSTSAIVAERISMEGAMAKPYTSIFFDPLTGTERAAKRPPIAGPVQAIPIDPELTSAAAGMNRSSLAEMPFGFPSSGTGRHKSLEVAMRADARYFTLASACQTFFLATSSSLIYSIHTPKRGFIIKRSAAYILHTSGTERSREGHRIQYKCQHQQN